MLFLSAIDHCSRPEKTPGSNANFTQFTDIEHSIPLVKEFCTRGIEWCKFTKYHTFTYFNLLKIKEIVTTFTINQIKGKCQYNTGALQGSRMK